MMRLIAFCIPVFFLLFINSTYSQDIGLKSEINNDNVTTVVTDDPVFEFRSAVGELVLLKNHSGLLPLDIDQVNSIALIGPTLFSPRIKGIGSSQMDPHSSISPYEGITNLLGDSVFLYTAQGVNMRNDITPLDTSIVFIGQGVNGFSAKYYNNLKASGTPAKFATDKQIDFNWGTNTPYPEIDSTAFSVKWDATLIPQHGPVKVKL
ncbi:MAG: glycoside hydrolase family 3 C-terminal domain-containing protein, partial [Bacteroidales bacterium]|nr:glycoside hydrolase family 3 C-terminal domain-containing protein [Bacteroidales bacterium]